MKKVVMVITAAVLLTFLVYQGSMAYFHAQTSVGARISAGTLGIDLVETSTHKNAVKTDKGYEFNSIMPGSEIDSTVHVENVKEKTLYIRVTATKYWEDEEGNKLTEADASLIKLITKDPENWIIHDDAENSNSEIVYFYYKKPIAANDRTTNMIDIMQVSADLKNSSDYGNKINLTLEADAIQSMAASDAMLSEWGIDVTFDQDGDIIDIED